jgi:hypothetical protein
VPGAELGVLGIIYLLFFTSEVGHSALWAGTVVTPFTQEATEAQSSGDFAPSGGNGHQPPLRPLQSMFQIGFLCHCCWGCSACELTLASVLKSLHQNIQGYKALESPTKVTIL